MNIQEEFNKVQRELKHLEEKNKDATRLYENEMRKKQDIEKIIALNESKKQDIEKNISKIEPKKLEYDRNIQTHRATLERLQADLNKYLEDTKNK
ncbi:MAG: hypothetical protein WDZ68_02255 [Candidatus Paceibacterota bacterium]